MAEKALPYVDSSVSSSTRALMKLEEQLTCPICLEFFFMPKTLPCLHSFCHPCLDGLPLDHQGDKDYISCPTCRQIVLLPFNGTAGLPVAFQINNLADVHNLMRKMSKHIQPTCDNCTTSKAKSYCKECDMILCQDCINSHKNFALDALEHKITNLDKVVISVSQLFPLKQEIKCSTHHEPLKIYCESCDELICHDCTVRLHRDHDYKLVSDCYPEHCQKLESALKSLSDKVIGINNAVTTLMDRENEILKQGNVVKEEIHAKIEEMINFLHLSENLLTRDVDTIVHSKLQVLSEQKESAEVSLNELNNCLEHVKQCLDISNHHELVTSTKQAMEHTTYVIDNFNIDDFYPKEKADIYFKGNPNFLDQLIDVGDVIFLTPTVLQQFKINEISPNHITINNKTAFFPFSITDPDSSLLNVPLSSLSCSLVPVIGEAAPIKAIVTNAVEPGVYILHCNSCGHQNINIQVNDVQIDTISVAIPFNPFLDIITPVNNISELSSPWGVAVTNDGHIIVSENERNCVTLLDRDPKKEKVFGKKGSRVKFTKPRGVACTQDNNIVVADNHSIQKISTDGRSIISVGKQGNGPLEFNAPHGIAISQITNHIYVADYYNNRIQVLNHDLSFSHSFGTYGLAEGQFHCPVSIAFDNKGLVYVTDSYNHRIQKFTPDGTFLFQFGTKGHSLGKLNQPVGITIDPNNLVYITENSNCRISIFTIDGQFVRSFGDPSLTYEYQISSPYGITFDKEGYLYVCDADNNRLVVY